MVITYFAHMLGPIISKQSLQFLIIRKPVLSNLKDSLCVLPVDVGYRILTPFMCDSRGQNEQRAHVANVAAVSHVVLPDFASLQ